MPWKAEDAKRKTKKANTSKRKRMWAHAANSALGEGLSEGAAVRIGNAAVRRDTRRKPSNRGALGE